MDRARMLIALLVMVACIGAAEKTSAPGILTDPFAEITRGALRVVRPDGAVVECPLKHSAYAVDIAGPVAQVTLVQTFTNPFPEPIEAVYVFPLSHESAVNSLEMEIGDRRIVGALLRRGDAKAVYEAAKLEGKTASLLDQERPNIFTQKVSNLPPHGEVRIRIGYVERLAYDRGSYEFHLPLVVGPRFIPGSPISGVAAQDPTVSKVAVPLQVRVGDGAPKGTGTSPDTNQVPDASRITPPVLKPESKAPYDVAIVVRIAAGMAIRDLRSVHHRVHTEKKDTANATMTLDAGDGIPNKDFVLRYAVDGERPAVGVVTHRAADGGYVLLTLQPGQLDEQLEKRVPRDLCFLVDVSGSMHGQPLAKAQAAMRQFLALAGPQDRIQVVTFAGDTHTCFADYLPATPENIRSALFEVELMKSGGGTQMLAGIQAVLDAPLDPARQRVVVMLTDGDIGNEAEIISALGKQLSDRLRFWCLGIGSSPNRYLVDGVAQVGGGMGLVLGLDEDAVPVVNGMMSRIQRPQLDQVEIDWGGLPISEMVPQRITSLWSGQPVRIAARCAIDQPQTATVTVRGRCDGVVVTIPVTVSLVQSSAGTAAVRTLWARERSREMQRQMMMSQDDQIIGAITDLSLRYSLMSPYTSFVAVDERIINPDGSGRRIDVTVPLPEGVSIEALPVLPREKITAHSKDLLVHSGVVGREMDGTGAFMSIGAGGNYAGMFGSRTGGGKRRALKAGGTMNAESAVDTALRFLKRHQGADGSWHPVTYAEQCTEAPKCEPGLGGVEDQVALTGQVVISFLDAGFDHITPNKYRANIAQALTFLRSRQQADGALAATVEAHAHALAALTKAFEFTNDPLLKDPAQRAVLWLLGQRRPGTDGQPLAWGDDHGISTALTIDATRALKFALSAGLNIRDGMDRAKVWTNQAWKAHNPQWAQLQPGQASRFPARWTTAGSTEGEDSPAGSLLAIFLGHHAGDILLESLVVRLKELMPTESINLDDPRALELTTWVAFQYGGDWWQKFRDAVVAAQRKDAGCAEGSWNPPTGMLRGRLQSTVLALSSIQFYYIYRLPAKP